MVKGVNKNVIEVNSTGSEMFEKIVFYVSPKFSGLGAKSLEKATDEIEKTLLLVFHYILIHNKNLCHFLNE